MPNNPLIKNTLLSIITFLKHKAEEKQLKPVITVAKLIEMLKSSGLSINYQQLSDLMKDPTISSSIKSINKNQVEFNLGNEEQTAPEIPEMPQPDFEESSEDDGDEFAPESKAGNEGENYNPDDFAFGEEGEATEPAQQEAPEPQESTVSQMAKRALNRAD